MPDCSRDCFNCPHDDCICDADADKAERDAALVRDAIAAGQAPNATRAERKRMYYYAHLDEVREKSRAYYQAHREQCKDNTRQWQYAHKAEQKKYKAAWYQRNKERLREKHRAYSAARRAAKKQEGGAPDGGGHEDPKRQA